MKKPVIIVIDDNKAFIDLFRELQEAEPYDIRGFTSAGEALLFLEKESADLVISDIQMPEMTGNQVLAKVQDINPDIPLILVTAYGSAEKGVEAIKKGAYHYFLKPINDKLDLFWKTVAEALEKRRTLAEIEALRREKSLQHQTPASMVGASDAIKAIMQSIRDVAEIPVTVLICGETGTGKELVARAIHEMSGRREKGYFAVNCHALSPGLLESELFGHERGAFTGAVGRKKGLFEIADKGTLFLDEIGNAPMALQAKLLRGLETREFIRVGGTAKIRSDFRIIAATNIPLEAEVAKGAFRPDLLYRLKVYTIDIPPLRERKEDIPVLARHYLRYFSERYARPIQGISEGALAVLGVYDWPGNVRELVNIMERAVITCRESMITTRHLPFQTREGGSLPGLNLEEMEKYCIMLALNQTRNNKTRAAELLGIHRKTLIEKVKKYGFEDAGSD